MPSEFSSASGESSSRNQIKIKSGPGIKKGYPVFSGENNEVYIGYLTNCNTVIQDKDLKPVIKGWSKEIEKTQDELDYHKLGRPASSPGLSTKPNMRKKLNEDEATRSARVAKEQRILT